MKGPKSIFPVALNQYHTPVPSIFVLCIRHMLSSILLCGCVLRAPCPSLPEPTLVTFFISRIQPLGKVSGSRPFSPLKVCLVIPNDGTAEWFFNPPSISSVGHPCTFPREFTLKFAITDCWKQRCPSAFQRATEHRTGKQSGILVSHRIDRLFLSGKWPDSRIYESTIRPSQSPQIPRPAEVAIRSPFGHYFHFRSLLASLLHLATGGTLGLPCG